MLDRSAIILAEESSENFGIDLSILSLRGKPVLQNVVDTINVLVDEVIVVVDSNEKKEAYAELLDPDIKYVVRNSAEKGLLFGAVKGFEAAHGKYSVLLSPSLPLASAEIIELLFELCHNRTAVIPRWPSQEIEPLQAVFHTKSALAASQMAIADKCFDLADMIENLGGVRYISTLAIQEFDPQLKTFFRVKTPIDLKIAENLSKPKPQKRAGRK